MKWVPQNLLQMPSVPFQSAFDDDTVAKGNIEANWKINTKKSQRS